MWVWTKVSEHVEGVRFPNLVSCLCFCISMWCFHLIGGWTVKVIVCSPGGKHLGFLPSGSSLLTWMVHLCRLHTVWCLVVTSLLTWAHGCGCGVALFCLGLTDLRLAHQVFRYQFFASRSHPCSHSLAVCHQARWLWSRWFFFSRSCCSSRQLLALNFSGIFVLSTNLYPLVAIDDVWRFVDDEVFKTWKRHLDALVPGGMSGRSRRAVPFLCPSLVPPLLVLALLGLCLSLRPEIWPCSFLRRRDLRIPFFNLFLSWLAPQKPACLMTGLTLTSDECACVGGSDGLCIYFNIKRAYLTMRCM